MRLKKISFAFVLLFIINSVMADELEGKGVPYNAYLDGGKSDKALILCHGRDHGPRWSVVDPLRKGVHEKLGYHTVSLQMPTGNGDWLDYAEYFPDAYARIAATVVALQKKGIKRIYLMGHSMGSRMATAYLANNKNHGIHGFIGVGVRNNGGEPLDSMINLSSVTIPVVDIWGDGGDGKDERHAEDRGDLASDTYQMVYIAGADHLFSDHEDKMVQAAVDWLKTQDNSQ